MTGKNPDFEAGFKAGRDASDPNRLSADDVKKDKEQLKSEYKKRNKEQRKDFRAGYAAGADREGGGQNETIPTTISSARG